MSQAMAVLQSRRETIGEPHRRGTKGRTCDRPELSSETEVAAVDVGEGLSCRIWSADVPLEAIRQLHRSDGNIELGRRQSARPLAT
jgi:hypothetical protein